MFRSLLINNNYSIEYINRQAVTNPDAFGLYIPAHCEKGAYELFDLKRKVMLALMHIDRCMDKKMLVAIYIDLHSETYNDYRAFDALSRDVRSGMFTKILLVNVNDFKKDNFLKNSMGKLVSEVSGLEYRGLDEEAFQSYRLPLNFLIGV